MRRLLYITYRLTFALRRFVIKRLTPAGQMVAAGLVVTAVFGANTIGNMAHQIFAFLAALILLALMGSRLFKVSFVFQRRLPRYASVGVPFSYRLEVHHRHQRGKATVAELAFEERLADPRPGWAAFSDPGVRVNPRGMLDRRLGMSRWRYLCRLGRQAASRPSETVRLDGQSDAEVQMTMTPLRRGRLDLLGVTASRPDPLGLVRSQASVDLYGSVLVLPQLYQVPALALPGRRQYQPGGVALASSVGDAEEFTALRDYRPGDPLRRIHWKSWARIGKPIVKEYQEEFFVRHALVLDTFHPVDGDPVFEAAVALAASIASSQDSETLLDLMFVGPEAYCFTCGRGLTQTDKMLEILAGVTVCRDKGFDTLLPLVLKRTGLLSAAICILVGWDEGRRRLVDLLRQLQVPVQVFVVVEQGASTALDPGPLRDRPERFRVLEVGRIQEALNQL